MSDTGFIFSIILWAGVNGLVGYLIGKPKNAIADCIALSLILGPIGWLIALAVKGKVRKCPFCAEHVKPEAKVCRHCGRDLPQIPLQSNLKATPRAPEPKIPPPAGGWRK
jgi:hypothetical protein